MASEAEEAMSNLPHDIIINIISRLPVKSLGQLKSTCKSWNSLISSSHFVKLQHQRAVSDTGVDSHSRLFMYTNPSYTLDYESATSLNEDVSAMVDLEKIMEGNYEGIVCSCYGFIYFVCGPDTVILYNPCTKHTRKLPNPPPISFSDAKFFYGLGYENITGDYKMVRVTRLNSNNITKVEVFNIQADLGWRAIDKFDNRFTILEETGMFADGTLHWKARHDDEYETILTLEVSNETLGEISLPKLGGNPFWTLGDLKGRICLQVDEDCGNIEIWVMKEYGVSESWTKLVTYNRRCNYMAFVCFARNGDAILNIDGWELVRFDAKQNTYRTLKKPDDDGFECFLYIESLVSPYGHNLEG